MTAMDARQLIREHWEYAKTDTSTLALVGSNLITVFIAIQQGWSVYSLMWVYLAQSIIIGFFNFLRMWRLGKSKQFEEFRFVPSQFADKIRRFNGAWFPLFFAFHYSGFHLGYLEFLLQKSKPFEGTSLFFTALVAAIFFANHWFSYCKNLEKDASREVSIGRMMLFPYARIVPMQLTVVIAALIPAGWVPLFVFILLKTLVDAEMHIIEHKI